MKKKYNYGYLEDVKDKNNSKEFEEILNKIERYKKDIEELKNELEETNNKNKILEEENTQLKLLLNETKLTNERDNFVNNEGSDMDIQLKLNPEQQITLEKLQELMIQLSKKIEKLKNDNETLKQKVVSYNEDTNEINVLNIIKTKNKNKCETEKFIDILTDEECRQVLFYICSHLKINDFTNIDTNLRNVEITIKSVPQMQKFISEVDDLVWKSKDEDKTIHKLSETLNEIKN
ncbi:hypothetical protein LY90DRAFT_678656 [Neocallimastix californiae]|uniref:Uncharacterized protein n=1 Tax=Neocallimastix californiae TaxID=1754190 RepID=A0A1Y1YUE2_9FUNG|nr:hypothetical protein LY90DRAFT_678656 [Neocallimastix californiae]|eukprot:ORY01652.1 hypothetical protein LY90DRAFT_678656 [Neocallimastix californiae]